MIQALPSEEQKFGPISELLGYVEKDAEKSISLLRQGQEEEAKETGLLALRCLVSIGKGLQAPDDLPVDLSEEEGPQPPSFWEASSGGALQGKIMNLVRMLCSTFNGDGEMVDAACAVFKTGFAETTPGLFVFRPERVTDFLLEHCACTETILSTAGTLISSHSTSSSADIVTQVLQLLQFIINLALRIGGPQTEPEIAQSIAEFASRLLRHYAHVLCSYQPHAHLEALFVFILDSLTVREALVKKAAAAFWSSFLSLATPASDEIIAACGPTLAKKLCWAIGGGCSRSEIEVLADPLRKLVTRQVRSKMWLTEALKPEGFPTENLGERDKRLFVEKVMTLRGKSGTNQVAKEFWLMARGTEFACMFSIQLMENVSGADDITDAS